MIVESPAKVRTIEKFLGKDFEVKASMGHVRDLPVWKLGVDVESNFEPEYEILKGKKKVVQSLSKAINSADQIYIATDEDREGEAIGWHLIQSAGIEQKNVKRIVFHEITKQAVLDAVKNPRDINMDLVDAQQARRILDRLVGYKISPLLSKNVMRGLSAGRVQSVALRLIVEREREIGKFKPEEYWSIIAELEKQNKEGGMFQAFLMSKAGKKYDKFDINKEEQAKDIISDLRSAEYIIDKITKKEKKRYAAPPFITSTMQQEASRRLGYSARKTMVIAQQLYEGIDLGAGEREGLITYMRTDSVNVAKSAQEQALFYIKEKIGADYAPEKPNFYKTKVKGAQEAHEAIRPTIPGHEPKTLKTHLKSDQYKLYTLIWQRFIASQMRPAILDTVTVDIKANDYIFRASGQTIKFQGFMKVYIEAEDNNETTDPENDDSKQNGAKKAILPNLEESEKLNLENLIPKQHWTQPPPRYSEATLIKDLEKHGIGRPSTYAPIISTIQTRKYVRLEKRCFYPEEIGCTVNDLLVKHFPNTMDIGFTARMEDELDEIAEGKESWQKVMNNFYQPFSKVLAEAAENMECLKPADEETDQICPDCSQPLVIKTGRYGRFYACTGFPKCKHTEALEENKSDTPTEAIDEKCDKCGQPMVIKAGRRGKFIACSGYPKCKNTKSIPTGVKCPAKDCDGELVRKSSRRGSFYGCSKYPECKQTAKTLPETNQEAKEETKEEDKDS
ncbi:MAG: type I DNA topoisomerase [Candidatus Omnitrophica bacterium]|nr:type I DNA topoisomerase [Candidatus Omnitrophota bacterium]